MCSALQIRALLKLSFKCLGRKVRRQGLLSINIIVMKNDENPHSISKGPELSIGHLLVHRGEHFHFHGHANWAEEGAVVHFRLCRVEI